MIKPDDFEVRSFSHPDGGDPAGEEVNTTTMSDEELLILVTHEEIEAKYEPLTGLADVIGDIEAFSWSVAIRRAVVAKYGDRKLGGINGPDHQHDLDDAPE